MIFWRVVQESTGSPAEAVVLVSAEEQTPDGHLRALTSEASFAFDVNPSKS